MYEIEIIYNDTMEHDFIYGHSVKDALQRCKIDPSVVTIGFVDYID